MKFTKDYLLDLLEHLDLIEQFTQDGKTAFMQNKMQQFAVSRAYEIIGEIVKRLPEEIVESHPEIDWQTLRRFRDFIAHNYEDIVLANIWIAVQDVPRLRGAVQDMINHMD